MTAWILLCEEAHQQIAYHLSKLRRTYAAQESELDDLRQDILLLLMQCSGRYDASRGAPTTFIRSIIKHQVQQFLMNRYRLNRKKQAALEDLEESDHPTVNDPRGGGLSDLERIYLKNDIRHFSQNMTPRQKTLCRLLCDDAGEGRIARNLKTQVKNVRRDLFELREAFLDGGYWDHGPRPRTGSRDRPTCRHGPPDCVPT